MQLNNVLTDSVTVVMLVLIRFFILSITAYILHTYGCKDRQECGYNEHPVQCRTICPPQNCDIAYTDYYCDESTNICEPGCDCLPNHLRNGSGICIPSDSCPYPTDRCCPVCGINEVAKDCRTICPPQTCESIYTFYNCEPDLPCEPGCDCIPNYLRDSYGICVPSEKCSELKQKCGYNEYAVRCKTICPPQNCDIAYTDYYCGKSSKKCIPGCDCLPNHLRNSSGICIPSDNCFYPNCGENEVPKDCRTICPPQTCESRYTLYSCVPDIPCEPGCDCIPNYLRDANGICVPSEECPEPCPIPDECKRTCTTPTRPDCPYSPTDTNIDGCNCKQGYILSDVNGKCIKIEECPNDLGCNGDPHARTTLCPLPCPSTCDAPNATPCKKMCEPIGCECDFGYLLSNITGKCILPEDCPCGNPCDENERFVSCKVLCDSDFCPVNDDRDIAVCDAPDPCLSGCVCKLNHRRLSREDPRCIVASDCPPVTCTRPNEVWNSCPSACLAENCEDIHNQPTTCNTLVLNCDPRCICKENHFRNASDICVPAHECPEA